MLAWIGYVTAIGCGASVSAFAAEGALRRLGRPARWVWAGAMVVSVAVPLAGLLGGGGASMAQPTLWRGLSEGALPPLVGSVAAAAWAAASLILLSNVRLSEWTLRRNERLWRRRSLAGQRVLVARGFGPGVIGAARPRIVFPEWVLEAAPDLRRLILLHEVEHVRAADTRLLLGAVVLVSLLPWSLPLWWQLHRLRGAVESDCDARVLAATGDARTYARALLEVAGRPSRTPLPSTGLASGRSELERRIRLITARGRGGRKQAFLAAGAASVMALALLLVPAPRVPALGLEARTDRTGPPPSAKVYLSIAPADADERPAR